MTELMLPAEIFSALDKDALASLAHFFHQLAREIEDYYVKSADIENAYHRIKFRALDRKASGEHALQLILSGMAEPEAIYAAAQTYDVTQEAAAYFLRKTEKRRLSERNAEIMTLAKQGVRNREIGERFDLRPETISRIIQKELRRRKCAL